MITSRRCYLGTANAQVRVVTTYEAGDEEAIRPILPGRTSDDGFCVFMIISN